MIITFAFCVILNVFLIALIMKMVFQPKYREDTYVKDDSEIRNYLAKHHYKNGIYVKFIKHIRSINPLYELEIKKGDIIWLERFVNNYESIIETKIIGSDTNSNDDCLCMPYHDCDPTLVRIEKDSEKIVIRLPWGFTDDELWVTPSQNEFIESLF